MKNLIHFRTSWTLKQPMNIYANGPGDQVELSTVHAYL
jgi:hypothetical protein